MADSKKTEQMNIRVPKELVSDLEILSEILKVNKSEWIKIKLSELVREEKSKLIQTYIDLQKQGIKQKELEKLLK